MMPSSPGPQENRLLAALPGAEQQRWFPQLESIELPLGDVLYESGTTLAHVYFPTSAIVSLLYVMENGASAEIAVVGNEGLVGISLFMGGGWTPSRAVAHRRTDLDAATTRVETWPHRHASDCFSEGGAVPPDGPSGLPNEDWDCLFRAVLARLSAAAGERPGVAPSAQAHEPSGRTQAIVLECVGALDRMRRMLPREHVDRLSL